MHSKDHGVSRGAGAHSSALAWLGHLVLASIAFELFYNLSCGERVMQNGFLLTDMNMNCEVRDSPPTAHQLIPTLPAHRVSVLHATL